MNKLSKILIVFTALVIGNRGFSQTIDPNYEVATWHSFRSAAITFTFDDGSPN